MKSGWFSKIIVFVLLMIFVLLSVQSAFRESLTFDEIVHIEEGKNHLVKKEFLIDTNNPPLIRELAVIPLIYDTSFVSYYDSPHMQAFPARLVIIFLAVILGVCIYVTAKKLFGQNAALVALFLYVFDPNILAYSHYVTQDIGSAVFFFATYITLVRLLKTPSWNSFIIHGFVAGCMAVSKVTTLPFYILADLLVIPYILRKNTFRWFYANALKVIVSAGIALCVIWSSYFFRSNYIAAPHDAQGVFSNTVNSLSSRPFGNILSGGLMYLRSHTVPLGDYIVLLKKTIARREIPAPTLYFGRYYTNTRWYFLPVMFVYKTPVLLLILFVLGVGIGLRNRTYRFYTIVLFIPVASILVVSAVSHMQPMIRYIIPIYPFIHILAGLSIVIAVNTKRKIALLVSLIYFSYSTLTYFPHFISYVNEFSGIKSRSFENFTDSNIDWGQSIPDLKQFIDTVKPAVVNFSYFGRDDAAKYGMRSDMNFGSYKFNEICAFHTINTGYEGKSSVTAISISNWHGCGYYLDPAYTLEFVKYIVGGSILIY